MRRLSHALTLVGFAGLAVLWTYPLAWHMGSAVIGTGPADNIAALWNVWWVHEALFEHQPLFQTPDLFAPFGTSLALHSYHPAISIATNVVAASSDPVVQYNAALLLSVFLNLACAYFAGWVITRDPLGAVFSGVAFGGSPFLLVRLHGHLNVLSAWGLPLLLASMVSLVQRPTRLRAIAVSFAFAMLGYSDYYFLIFGAILVLVVLLTATTELTVSRRPLTNVRRRALIAICALVMAAVAVSLWIAATGGADSQIAGIRVRMTETFNLRVAIGFLVVLGVAVATSPRVQFVWRASGVDRQIAGAFALAVTLAGFLLAPLLAASLRLWISGDYSSQVYFWRSAPSGIDIAALGLGNPIGWFTGRWTSSLYDRLGVHPVESAVWLGLAPIALALFAAKRRGNWTQQAMTTTALLFFVWSLGPYLRIAGWNSGFMLPQTFLRFVPIVANARIPGRAFALVVMAVAMLGAIAIAGMDGRRRTTLGMLAVAVLVGDFWPAPFPMMPVDPLPSVYARLTDLPYGNVLELPLGVRDGFGERGRLNHLALLYQTRHHHPEFGGFLARVSDRIKRAYDEDPIVGPILNLSEGRAVTAPSAPATSMAPQDRSPCVMSLACRVRYVVIDERTASEELSKFARQTFTLSLVERSADRSLYTVEGVPACRCQQP